MCGKRRRARAAALPFVSRRRAAIDGIAGRGEGDGRRKDVLAVVREVRSGGLEAKEAAKLVSVAEFSPRTCTTVSSEYSRHHALAAR
jgi:hypothetical protein